MTKNPLQKLREYGQSIWLDFFSRGLVRSGRLKELMDSDGVTGITSNPAIFEKAIGGGDYDDDIRKLMEKGKTALEIYEELAVADIQEAAGVLRPIFDRSQGQDGYISLEVSPKLAYDTDATVREAKRLWAAVNRPNAMIKIPATREGLPAIAQSTAAGVNVNITLLFGLPRYREVTEAYLSGLEQRAQKGQDLHGIRSVASFFLSRIDVLVDPKLENTKDLQGTAAIASAKVAYQIYKEIFGSERFQKLAEKGARKQWLLWGSTSTKNKAYSDVKYVEALIGPETINTIPVETLDAYRDHGSPEPRLEQDPEGARKALTQLRDAGIDIDEITEQLVRDGIDKFIKPFDKMLHGIEEKIRSLQTV